MLEEELSVEGKDHKFKFDMFFGGLLSLYTQMSSRQMDTWV